MRHAQLAEGRGDRLFRHRRAEAELAQPVGVRTRVLARVDRRRPRVGGSPVLITRPGRRRLLSIPPRLALASRSLLGRLAGARVEVAGEDVVGVHRPARAPRRRLPEDASVAGLALRDALALAVAVGDVLVGGAALEVRLGLVRVIEREALVRVVRARAPVDRLAAPLAASAATHRNSIPECITSVYVRLPIGSF